MTTSPFTIELASGEPLDVREFSVEEGISRLFDVNLTAVSTSVDVDFEAAIGAPARFELHRTSAIDGDARFWSGICARVEQIGVEEQGLSTYAIRVVPALWLLTQRRNYSVFQDKSELDIALEILADWSIEPALELDPAAYGKRRMRVQYAESDFDFMSRLLEDIGVAFYFEQVKGDTRLVLADAPNRRAPRAPIPFVDKPNERVAIEYVTDVRSRREVQPGRYTQSDVDYRKPLSYPLAASASRGTATEAKLERYHHNYGSFLWKAQGGDTPSADDRGAARTSERDGKKQVEQRIDAKRSEARGVTFRTIAHDLRPGKVFTVSGHPRRELAAPLLVVAARLGGDAYGDWSHTCEARYTDIDYRPPLKTPKPRTLGVESATVTGPAGEEIHTDEFGRVRVHFHWDRKGAADETSSCWIPVSQAWAGAGFGAISLPRVGQEVLVDFLGADPDRPVVMGRVFTTTTPPPYALPKHKMVSGLRSETYPRSGAGSASGGGGMPGGGSGQAAAGEADPSGEAMPGAFGGKKAKHEELSSAVGQMSSVGPDQVDHNRSANGLVFDDQARNERVYLQGQNDFSMTIKRNATGTVGANRAYTVLGNDSESVPRGFQSTQVGRDRTLEVGGTQRHTVQGDIITQGMSNHVIRTQQTFLSETVDGGQVFQAKTGILLRVGTTAAIFMTPSEIVIDAPKVYINPGPQVMANIYSGQPVEQAVENAQREARIMEARDAILRFEGEEQARGAYTPQVRQNRLRATAMGSQTPVSSVANRVTRDNQAESAEAARRAYAVIYPDEPPIPPRR